MDEVALGKELKGLRDDLDRVTEVLQQLYNVIEHNVKTKKLEEPPTEVKK